MSVLLPGFIMIPIVAAVLNILSGRLLRRLPEIISALTAFYLLCAVSTLYFFRPFNYLLDYKMLGINLKLDGFSHIILLAVCLVVFLVVLYASAYMEKYPGKEKFFALYMLMTAGMNGVLLSRDLFSLFLFLELAAISTYLLVGFKGEAEEIEASIRYLIIGTIASVLILIGIGLFYNSPGTAKSFIAVLFLAGFGMKAAIVPFHAWLPDAHTAAPAPVSATLSGILIKVLGVYALARIFYNFLGMTPQYSIILTCFGILSILIGGLLAFGQRDLKRLLAYSSISQIGYIVLGLSLGTPLGIMGGIFHLINHAIFKPLLFLNAGSVEQQTGTRNLDELGGLYHKMPITSITSLIGSLSISGIPPFSGFWSKLFIIIACVQAGNLWAATAAILGSILTLSYFLKVQKLMAFDKLPEQLKNIKESPAIMSFAVIILAFLCLIAGIFYPYVVDYLINPAVIALSNGVKL